VYSVTTRELYGGLKPRKPTLPADPLSTKGLVVRRRPVSGRSVLGYQHRPPTPGTDTGVRHQAAFTHVTLQAFAALNPPPGTQDSGLRTQDSGLRTQDSEFGVGEPTVQGSQVTPQE
jgi:hypothetical protein